MSAAEAIVGEARAGTALEHRYRRALRWYPARWRARHEEVVLSTLLDGADADGRTEPGRGEIVNLAVTGVATRASVVLPVAMRDLIATVALGAGTVLALLFLVVFSWSPWASPDVYTARAFPSFGPFVNLGPIVYVLWPVALLLALLRRGTALRWVLVAAVLAPPALRLVNWLQGDIWLGPMATTLGIFSLLALCALLGTPQRGVRMLATVVVSVAMASVSLATVGLLRPYYVDDHRLWSFVSHSPLPLIVLGLVAIAIPLGIARMPHAALFAIGLAAPWGLLCLVGALYSDRAGTFGIVVIATIALGIWWVVSRAIRRSREALGGEVSRS